jgi:aspartyl-tRNA(Asn)/glutamyl-tRNA(Gln) amidotransferase subunit C
MKVDKELIEHVADVARLKLSDKEIDKFIPEFKEILGAFSKLDEVDTKDAISSFHPVELKNQLREDVPKEGITNEEALSLTEHKKDGYFKGPKAI